MTLNGNERYLMVLNGTSSVQWYTFRCLFTIQSTTETNKCTVDVFNGIERYWTVLNGIPFADF